MANSLDTYEDNFREVFKYYKRRKPPPEFSNVLDFNSSLKRRHQRVSCHLSNEEEDETKALGLTPCNDWKIFDIDSHPGLLFIQNPFTSKGQLMWIKSCLVDFPCSLNRTNLDSHGITLANSSWWEQANSNEGKEMNLVKKLRWVTLGYHHNWDTKEYSEKIKSDMPENLQKLCFLIAKGLGFQEFRAEAAIVNYYHEDSSLGPHTDHSEPNMTAPLFSFSFGQSAVFLIGGPTRHIKPTALYLHSGDILIMTGDSRLAYHAVPRIVLVDNTPWNTEEDFSWKSSLESSCSSDTFSCTSSKEMRNYSEKRSILDYVKTSRINMNVRQVLVTSVQDNLL